ncbi:MAG: shikimate kinase [Acidobacteria bacterium]|nr:MAG: shikimate kinase [Acidobacteriota bacterium]
MSRSLSSVGMVWLVGLPGSGKSTVGAAVARRLRRPFVDLDHEIEKAAAQTVAGIFTTEGEAGFRRRESRVLRSLVVGSPPRPVVACGGGIVEGEGNRALMAGAGAVIWLDLPLEKALARCRRRPEVRPLMAEAAAYRRRLEMRIPLYRALGCRVDAGGAITQVVTRVLSVLA